MKLYAWQPKGHGELSFFVMADSEDTAKESINEFIKKHKGKYDDDFWIEEGDIRGLWTDYYELTVCDKNQVLVNYND